MTDADLIAKKLAFIETCVRELREIAHPERIGHSWEVIGQLMKGNSAATTRVHMATFRHRRTYRYDLGWSGEIWYPGPS